MTYLVATKKTKYYDGIIFAGGTFFIAGIACSLIGYFGTGEKVIYLLSTTMILALLFVLFGIYMPNYLTPDYSFIEETIENSDGKKVRRKKIHYN